MTAGTWAPHDPTPICGDCFDTGMVSTFDTDGEPIVITCRCERTPRW